VVSGVLMFFANGLLQATLPWGTKSVSDIKASPEVGKAIASTTQDGMMYVNEGVAAFIAVKPQRYYVMSRFFGIEFVTQLIAGAALTGALMLTRGQPLEARLGLVALIALMGIASIDLSYWNWWGFSTRYTLGVAVNRFVIYMVAGAVLALFIVR
jgi:hypothetical protein